MLISTLGPREIIKWFEEQDASHEVLCCMITADPKQREVLKNLAENFVDADAALGELVGFVMFGASSPETFPRTHTEAGHELYLPGEFVRRARITMADRVSRLRDRATNHSVDTNQWTDRAIDGRRKLSKFEFEMLSKQSADIASQWIEVLQLERARLPMLCVLVKGAEPILIHLKKDIDVSSILSVFARLSDIAHRADERSLRLRLDQIGRVESVARLEREIEKLKSRLVHQLEAICSRYGGTLAERQTIVQFLARPRWSGESLEELFASCESLTTGRRCRDSSVRGARKSVTKLTRALHECEQILRDMALEAEDVSSLADALENLLARRRETAKLVADLRDRGIDSKSLEGGSLGVAFDRTASRATQALDLLDKMRTFLSWVIKSAAL